MNVISLVIIAIAPLLLNYIVVDAKIETPKKTTTASKGGAPVAVVKKKNVTSTTKNSKSKTMSYWMAKMGFLDNDLMNLQAVVVKDEDVKATCDTADRKSTKRYIMCAGSILNRNHVLTSATCLHDATHIRHNVRAPLAVVIAPLKPSIQVIAVRDYQIHPQHHTNPYSKQHLRHNVAILKLACRINMENFHKIDLPRSPMTQTCTDDNCVVAVYRKTGRTSNVMFQMLAPDMPYPNRRRKETSPKDSELAKFSNHDNAKIINDEIISSRRSKRKLAEPPNFVGNHKYEKKLLKAIEEINVTSSTTSEDSSLELTTLPSKYDSAISVNETSLDDDVSEALRRSGIGNATVKSLVVRSSRIHRACALTGAPIVVNKTQAALVAVPCDDRQASSRWHYSDLFDNLDFIHDVLQDLEGLPHWPEFLGGTKPPEIVSPANVSGCSTCIFNFFIEIGCKDKNGCGKNYTASHVHTLPGQGLAKVGPNTIAARRRNQDCPSGSQDCQTTGKDDRSDDDKKSAEPTDHQHSPGLEKDKQTPLDKIKDSPQSQNQPITDRTIVKPIENYMNDNDKYAKLKSRISDIAKTYKNHIDDNKNRERMNNDIGLQNIDDNAEFLSEVEKGLGLNTEVKRDLVKSGGLNVKYNKK